MLRAIFVEQVEPIQDINVDAAWRSLLPDPLEPWGIQV